MGKKSTKQDRRNSVHAAAADLNYDRAFQLAELGRSAVERRELREMVKAMRSSALIDDLYRKHFG